MNPDYILLTGIKNPQRLQDRFRSEMVDVAYAELLGGDRVKVLVELSTDLRKKEDVDWIMGFVTEILHQNGELDFTTEVILVPLHQEERA